MNVKNLIIFVLIAVTANTFAQNKITVEEIYSGAFRTESMDELQSLKNSNQYTVLNFNRPQRSMQIDLYDFSNLKKVATLIDSKDHATLPMIDQYSFNQKENIILIACNSEQIYRHSFEADYYLYDINTKVLTRLFDYKIQEPTFSPDGNRIAYAKDNNLFTYNLKSKEVVQITTDGEKNSIINGITDWVYEEEFAFVKAFDWNSTGDKIAYIKFNESEVPEFSMDIYTQGLYPTQQVFKYPKAGEKNATVSLHIYDLKNNATQNVDFADKNDFYIPRIKWTNDSNILSAQVMNRHQNTLELMMIDATKNSKRRILLDTDDAYVDVTDNLTFLRNNSFIWTSEKDGFNHIYHYTNTGKLINQVTTGNWEVTKYYGLNEKTQTIYYQSVENGSINRDIYSIQLNGKNKKRLSSKTGTNDATFSPNFEYFILTFSNTTTPTEYSLHKAADGQAIQQIKNNEKLSQKLTAYNLPQKEFFTLKTSQGHELNAWIMKPKNFDANKKHPVLMHQYSGPGSQQVDNGWNSSDDYFHYLLTQEGYIIVTVDGRGTGYKGAEFKKCTYKELGKFEVEDQIEAAKIIGNYPYVDKSRIGIWGWSYGGFMSSNCILKGNDIFKTAVAVAPVTTWRLYDTIYTERFLQTPQENASGYDQNSPINFAQDLKGNYLIIHGSADDNVHVQNTMLMVEALIQHNKQFDWAIYPDKNHGIYGGATRIQLFNKIKNYLLEKL